jgi:hypothetical protein
VSEKSLDVLGTEKFKAEAMMRISLQTEALTTLVPNEPLWLFKPQAQAGRNDYETGWGLPMIFSPNGDPAPGIVTTHDEFAISWDAKSAKAKVDALLATHNEVEARELFQLCTQDQWNYSEAKAALAGGDWKQKIVPILYRPFDIRTTIYDHHVAVHLRDRVMGNCWVARIWRLRWARQVKLSTTTLGLSFPPHAKLQTSTFTGAGEIARFHFGCLRRMAKLQIFRRVS